MKPTNFQIEFTKERIIPSEGLTLVERILENSGFIDHLNKRKRPDSYNNIFHFQGTFCVTEYEGRHPNHDIDSPLQRAQSA